ncbi:TlpA family protein disulfide reductase [Tenacibaculum sp. TC6]|uniref:TlpA family protein disulfide reductase n=1 Tax=Tenacibaculum sp. TC6 TaxID=3423223 RepID=UPI003D3637A5
MYNFFSKIIKLIIFIIFLSSFSCKKNEKVSVIFNEVKKFEFIDFSSIKHSLDQNIEIVEYESVVADVNDQGKFKLFLIDRNKNGIFNDSSDIILINPYYTEKPIITTFESNLEKRRNLFLFNEKIFEITSFVYSKPMNKYKCDIKWLDNEPIKNIPFENRMLDKLPEISYNLPNGETQNLKKLKNSNKFIYIEFWSPWCSPCISNLEKITTLNKKYSQKIRLLTLCSDKKFNKDDVMQYVDKFNLHSVVGVSTKKINDYLGFDRLPFGYLFDENGKLLIFDATPSQIEYFLEKNKY